MASKRPSSDDSQSGGGGPQCKKVQFEPVRLGAVSSLEEMDMKVLQFQNRKLSQRLEVRQRTESELRQRIEQLEKRQMQDDAVLNVINRYWNQLNEDVRILLQRFDAETADENESRNESEATTSFLALLSTWDKAELDEKLANRVLVSQRAVAKLIRAFDRLLQRNEKITLALKGDSSEGEVPQLDETVKQVNAELQSENSSLHSLNTSLHEKNHTIALKLKELQEQLTAKETEAAELQNRVDDLDYELQKRRHRADSLENHLAEALEKLKQVQQQQQAVGVMNEEKSSGNRVVSVSQKKMEDLQKELEEQREMASNRLAELDRLHQNHRDVLQQLEHLKMDIRQLPLERPSLPSLLVTMVAQRAAQVGIKRWINDAGTYPILAVCGLATAVCTFQCTRYLVGHPDVNWNKQARMNNSMYRYDSEYGANWQSHRRWFATIYKNKINESKGL